MISAETAENTHKRRIGTVWFPFLAQEVDQAENRKLRLNSRRGQCIVTQRRPGRRLAGPESFRRLPDLLLHAPTAGPEAHRLPPVGAPRSRAVRSGAPSSRHRRTSRARGTQGDVVAQLGRDERHLTRLRHVRPPGFPAQVVILDPAFAVGRLHSAHEAPGSVNAEDAARSGRPGRLPRAVGRMASAGGRGPVARPGRDRRVRSP